MALSGAVETRLTEKGDLEIRTPLDVLVDEKPSVYQEIAGECISVAAAYRLERSGDGGDARLGFVLGEYDRDEILVIDPVFLVYCGYIGGADRDYGSDIAVDAQGNAYIVGTTWSSETEGFPVLAGPDPTYNGGDSDAYAAKVAASGEGLIYCGYIGGSEEDGARGIVVDKEGNAYVTGGTWSSEASFPVYVGPDLTFNGGGTYSGDAFVAKISASGDTLEYCGYIGGSSDDSAAGIAVDGEGCAYVAGNSKSSEALGFPVMVGPDLTFNGGVDPFVAKVEASGASLLYCGYIGGWYGEVVNGIAVDKSKRAYIAGYTYTTEYEGFPVKVGPDLTFNGDPWYYDDGFVARIAASGESLDYCGYVGGNADDQGLDIAADDEGHAYFAGHTFTKTFPKFSIPGEESSSAQGSDAPYYCSAFAGKVAASGESLLWCGLLGADEGMDYAEGIALDAQGNVYLTGQTRSSERIGFPVLEGPDLTHNGLDFYDYDAFVAKIEPSGTYLVYCGYIGGTKEDDGRAITVDNYGSAYVIGSTESSEEDAFPLLKGPDYTYNGSGLYGGDAFVAKVAMSLSSNGFQLPTGGGTIEFALHAGPGSAGRNYVLLGSASGTAPGIPLPGGAATLPLVWDPLTDFILLYLNSAVFEDFLGKLDGSGAAMARLNAPPLDPAYAGVVIYFAYCLNGPFDFASNATAVEVVP